MKIRRIEIKDYRGIKELAADVGEGGMVVSGKNAAGKTSVLRAIAAALSAQGCNPEDIRNGADQAEIFVGLDKLRVRRKITAAGPSLTVKNADGDTLAKPQSRLLELLGTAPLDALDFYLAPKNKRRQLVLDALPIAVSADDLHGWGISAALVSQLGTSGHGLEVVERYRKHFYDLRTQANREAKEAQRQADAAAEAAPIVEPDDSDGAAAAHELTVACTARDELAGRMEGVARLQVAQQKTRERIEILRRDAAAGPRETVTEVDAVIAATERDIADLRSQLALFENGLEGHRTKRQAAAAARASRDQADELERTLDTAGAVGVTNEERLQAEGRVNAAVARAEKATKAAVGRKAWQAARESLAASRDAGLRAGRLDEVVKALTDRAPAHLASKSGGIPGLTIDGDRILMEGVDVDALSGAEQMRFAVQLARRLNEKAQILVVDGLERLDHERALAFVKEATADGWQLLATRVADGELVIEAIAL